MVPSTRKTMRSEDSDASSGRAKRPRRADAANHATNHPSSDFEGLRSDMSLLGPSHGPSWQADPGIGTSQHFENPPDDLWSLEDPFLNLPITTRDDLQFVAEPQNYNFVSDDQPWSDEPAPNLDDWATSEHADVTSQAQLQHNISQQRRQTMPTTTRQSDSESISSSDDSVSSPHPEQRAPALGSRAKAKARGRFRCQKPNCAPKYKNGIGFGSKNDLERHYRDVHHINLDGSPINFHYCPWSECGEKKRFVRHGNLRSHIKSRHGGRWPIPQLSTEDFPRHIDDVTASGAFTVPDKEIPNAFGDEDFQQPDKLTGDEESDTEVYALYQFVNGCWYLRRVKSKGLDSINTQLEVMENDKAKLQQQMSSLKANIDSLTQIFAKYAGTDSIRQQVHEQLDALYKCIEETAARLRQDNTKLETQTRSRDEMLAEIKNINEIARCYSIQLKKRRAELSQRSGSSATKR